MLKQKNRSWYVLITKPRSEKKTTSQLKQLGVEAFCPVRREVRQWSDRKKKVEVPLLPSMILVNLDEVERPGVFKVAMVKRYLFWLGKPAKVTPEEVAVLRRMEQQKYSSLSVENIRPGMTMDLKEFGLEAERGTVKYVSGKQCWVVLNSLGYVLKLQIA